MSLPWLEPYPIEFPAAESALPNPNGLLAAGGGLSTEWLLCAYRQGIFPWYESGQPILWWSPDPRLILLPEQLKISKSLRNAQDNFPPVANTRLANDVKNYLKKYQNVHFWLSNAGMARKLDYTHSQIDRMLNKNHDYRFSVRCIKD